VDTEVTGSGPEPADAEAPVDAPAAA
jgi:hypothetical protein